MFCSFALLDRAQIGFVRPRGAFYLMVELGHGTNSSMFAVSFLKEQGVAVVPGSGFGPSAEGMVRVSLSVAPNDLDEGMRRLINAIARDRPTAEGDAPDHDAIPLV